MNLVAHLGSGDIDGVVSRKHVKLSIETNLFVGHRGRLGGLAGDATKLASGVQAAGGVIGRPSFACASAEGLLEGLLVRPTLEVITI